jgi:gag-polypeptide of LTR copia-type
VVLMWCDERMRFLAGIGPGLSQIQQDHLMHKNISRTYMDTGTISGQLPAVQWRMHEAIIKQIFSISIPDSVFNQIKSAVNIKSLWEELIRLMEACTKIYVIDLERWLHITHCGPKDNVHDHLQNLANMWEHLAAAGKDIADNQFASLMLNSLPPSYHSTTSSIIVMAEIGEKTLLPQSVARLITDKYQQHTAEDHRREEQLQRKQRCNEAGHHHKRKQQEPQYHWEGSDDQEADEPNNGHHTMSISELWLAIDANEDVASLHTPFTQISLAPTVRDGPWDRLKSANNATNKVIFVEEASNSGLLTYKSTSNVEQHADEYHCEGMIGSADKTTSNSPHKISIVHRAMFIQKIMTIAMI